FENAVNKARQMADQLGETAWHGFRVLAIDGTKKIMPYSEQLEAFFGIPSGSYFPQLLTCTLYDVLAKIPLDFVYGSIAASERDMARLLYKDLQKSDLLLMDRGFPSFEILSDMLSCGFQFLVRVPITGMFKEVRAFLDKGRVDGILTIHPPVTLIKKLIKQGKTIPAPICLRVAKIKLPDGRKAVFVTTLLDKKTYSLAELRELYHKRWQEEEFYKLTKGLLEAENFRGKCALLIGQELIAIHLYCLLTRVLIMESAVFKQVPTDEIPQQAAFLAVSRYLDKIWTCSNVDECRRLLQMCIVEIGWGKYRQRPDRSFPRKSKSCYGKWGRK
ncbi:MAG: IS4 family transposase, partial [Syntrophobacteraceae bacterium]|nr:IS4 family transposase [Syntrophobacteraceae bacterium]